MQKVLFIDRDGTLIEEPRDCQVDALAKIRLLPDVIPALLALQTAGFQLVMVSNQDGLGTADFPQAAFQQCHDFILALFASQGITFSHIFICPHKPADHCDCRKPKTGLLEPFLQHNPIARQHSFVIGDRETDHQLAQKMAIAFLPITPTQGWKTIAATILQQTRSAQVRRTTNETTIDVKVTLDSNATNRIHTPIGFFSHMLEQIAKHAGFCLEIDAKGDLQVDEHHLIEDTAIALGEALQQALGDKWGIARYGFTLPMDEALASVTLDLCSRSHCTFDGQFTREYVGNMATEMVPHFFNTLAKSLGASLHIKVRGYNHHHMIEACFKALGRALRQACRQCDHALPSTKGLL